jgi:hypothetical protein
MSPNQRRLTLEPIIEMADLAGDVPTRSRYRTLTSKGIVSKGWRVPRRADHGLEGSGKFHSVLTALAVKALNSGDEVGASYLGAQAKRVEDAFGEEVVDFLKDRTVAELPAAAFYARLLRATDDAIGGWSRCVDFVYGTGVVLAVDEEDLRLDVVTNNGEAIEIALPPQLADLQGLTAGANVWVWRALIGRRANVELLKAVEMHDLVEMHEEREDLSAGGRYLQQGAGAATLPAEAMAALTLIPQGALPVSKVKRLAG